jgi:hypothetical protein
VSLVFGDGDSDGWLRAEVAASRSLAGPWTTVVYGELFYALAFEGREFASAPLRLGRQTPYRHEARYWRLSPAGAPPRDQPLELTLEFQQERLRIAAGGTPPYLLAAGTLAEDAGPDATLVSVWSTLDGPAEVPLATLGARRELGGPDALVAGWRFPWRTATLWTVLIGGVLVVGAMAVRLAQEMRSQPS